MAALLYALIYVHVKIYVYVYVYICACTAPPSFVQWLNESISEAFNYRN